MNIFGFLNDIGNYDSRKIGRFEYEFGFISTCQVSDGSQPYETAVCDSRYRDEGKMVIVEAYDSKQEAVDGHNKWVDIMSNNPPPALRDCCNAEIGQLVDAIGGELVWEKKA